MMVTSMGIAFQFGVVSLLPVEQKPTGYLNLH